MMPLNRFMLTCSDIFRRGHRRSYGRGKGRSHGSGSDVVMDVVWTHFARSLDVVIDAVCRQSWTQFICGHGSGQFECC